MTVIARKEHAGLEHWEKELRDALQTKDGYASWQICLATETLSTMDLAKEFLLEGGEVPALVMAERQTQGRGRRGNSWLSPKGSLAATFLLSLPDGKGLESLTGYSLAVGLAIVEALEVLCGPVARSVLRLKWPNDIYSETGEKLGGILIETFTRDQKSYVAVGVGFNLERAPFSISNSMSLSSLLPVVPSMVECAAGFAQHIRAVHTDFFQNGFQAFLPAWMESAIYLGERVRIEDDQKCIDGLYRGVDEQGCALIEQEHVEGIQRIASGQLRLLVEHLFPY
jgi:BirA family biotin operon repressor/biotin-[acetyl-CoA-carboxylase] ligase